MSEQPDNNSFNWKKNRRVASLIALYIQDALTPAEHDELDEWVGASQTNMRIFEELTDEKNVQQLLNWIGKTNLPIASKKSRPHSKYPKRHYLLSRGWHYAIAASLIWIIGIAIFLIYTDHKRSNPVTTVEQNPKMPALPENKVVYLDGNGRAIYQGESPKKQYGQMKHKEVTQEMSGQEVYHIKATSGVGLYSGVLSERAEVSLNTPSSNQFLALVNGAINSQKSIRTKVGMLPPSSPLFIIDGIPFLTASASLTQKGTVIANTPFTSINPDDVERIEILKGENLTAVYGSLGANGIVSITTKKAKSVKVADFQSRHESGDAEANFMSRSKKVGETYLQDDMFKFENENLSTITSEMYEIYGVRVYFDMRATKKRYTISFYKSMPFTEVLKLLEEFGEMRFNVQGKFASGHPIANFEQKVIEDCFYKGL